MTKTRDFLKHLNEFRYSVFCAVADAVEDVVPYKAEDGWEVTITYDNGYLYFDVYDEKGELDPTLSSKLSKRILNGLSDDDFHVVSINFRNWRTQNVLGNFRELFGKEFFPRYERERLSKVCKTENKKGHKI